jgi:exosortase
MTSGTPSPWENVSIAWWRAAWIGLLICVLFAPIIIGMGREWATNEDMGHGFFVPAVAAYIVWQRRAELERLTPRPHWSGYPLLVWGFIQLMLGIFAAEFFLSRVALLFCLVGALLATGGWPLLRMLLFPLALLPFMIRIPAIVYSQITLPLQLLASQIAEISLQAIGVPVLRDGNILELASQRLSVVEACSGIRSLLSLLFLSLVYGYFFETRTLLRTLLVVLTVPIAIGANALRITLTGLIGEWNREYAQGIFHSMEGWVIFMVALLGLLLAHRLLTLLFRRRAA